ncbi:MAG TPA: alpha/beta hydrolase [Vicinamibacterales bacterium]|nr:alpha/beta hydrolase [Vicinamibacterales bacterium]
MTGIIQRGEGPAIVLVPGLQGRHEWQLPTVAALAACGQVSTFSLCDEPTSGFTWTEAAGFENYLAQLDEVLRATAAERPLLVGISYGGLIAAEYAARRPGTVAGLVLASAPPPGWTLPARAQRYLTAPRLMAPAFWLGAPLRLYPELRAAFPAGRDLLHFVVDHGLRVAGAPASTARMVRRLRWLTAARFSTGRPIPVPALIVTGEAGLERVVPPADTLRYLEWLPHARVVTMPHTGHSGTVTRAGDFARLVADFMMSRSLRADRVS